MKRKGIIISLLVSILGISVFMAMPSGNIASDVSAAGTTVSSDLKSVHDSISTTDEIVYITDSTVTYNMGDGSLAKYTINANGISNGAYVRDYGNKHTTYYLYLKYSSHDYQTSGAYVQIDAAKGKSISSVNIAGFKESGCGIQIQTMNAKTGLYEVERTFTSTTDAATFDFAKDTPSVRLHEYNTVSGTYKLLQIKNSFSATVDNSTYKTITFDSKGGTDVKSAAYYPGEVTVEPAAPTKPNEGSTKFTFAGWYTDTGCTSGNEFTFGNQLLSDTTLYAKWDESVVTGVQLTFVTNSSSVIAPQVVEFGEKFSVPSEVPTKDSSDKYDYTFEAWYADSELTTLFDFDVAYSNDQIAYAKYTYALNEIPGATIVSMKTKIKIYGATWSSDVYEEHTVSGLEVNTSMVDSTFGFKNAYGNGFGIKRAGDTKYDVYMKKCIVSWELNDYSKYIQTVRWDIKNTGYKYGHPEYIIRLYGNAAGTGAAIDAESVSQVNTEGTRAVQMTNNTDETINSVSFKQDYQDFNYGFENISYILGDASDTQQTKFFSKAFLEQFTCDGVGSVTAAENTWSTFASRISTMSANAKSILEGDSSTDQVVIDALARYDLVIRKYGTSQYADFLNRFGGNYEPSGLFMSNFLSDGTGVTMTIVLVSLVSLTIVAGFFFVKRRKENN